MLQLSDRCEKIRENAVNVKAYSPLLCGSGTFIHQRPA